MKLREDQAIELLYRGKSIDEYPIIDSAVTKFNRYAEDLELHEIVSEVEYSKDFNIPQYYRELNVEKYILNLAKTPEEIVRVHMELAIFKARNLYPILQLMIYIITVMRQNNCVWGVGRGSSVASYCLYLIGVHKINSIKYNLDIREFLK